MLKNLRTGTAILVSLLMATSVAAQSISPLPDGLAPRTGIFTLIQPIPRAPAEPAAPQAATPPAAVKAEVQMRKPVNVPTPPRLDPGLRASENAAAAPITPAPVPPTATETAATPPAPATAEPAVTAMPAAEAELPTGWKLVNIPSPPRLDKSLRIAAARADKDKAEKLKAEKADAEKAKTDQAALDPAKAAEAPAAEVPKVAPAAPPQPDKTAKGKNGKLDALTRAAPAAEPVAPAGTKATGIFSLFDRQISAAEHAGQQDSSSLVMPDNASAFAAAPRRGVRTSSLGLLSPIRPRRGNGDLRDDDLEDEEGGGTSLEKQVDSVQTACLKPALVLMIKQTGDHFGAAPIITSGFRNRGRRGSFHRRCAAADFQIPGVSSSQIVAYLRALPGAGGVGTYCHTKSVHLDTGTPRNWHQCGFQRSFALRTPAVAAAQ